MKLKFPVMAALALLAGCSAQDPAPQPSQAAEAIEAPLPAPVMGPEMQIVALGDSLFAGYGLEPGQSYPAHLEAALRARGINAKIVNGGVSGDTTAGGLARIDFLLDAQPRKPDLVLISLGGNDMLRGLSPDQTRANLDALLTKLGERKIKIMMMGMLAAPNLGADYAGKFNPIYPTLARKHKAALVPFFLQPLVDHPELVQADHIHPTLQGVDKLVGATVETVAKELPKEPGG